MMNFFFVTADMLREIFDHIPQFSLSKKNAALDRGSWKTTGEVGGLPSSDITNRKKGGGSRVQCPQ